MFFFSRTFVRLALLLIVSAALSLGAYRVAFDAASKTELAPVGASLRYAGTVVEAEEYVPGGAAAYILKDSSGKVVVISLHGAPAVGKHVIFTGTRDITNDGQCCVRESRRWVAF